MKRHGAVRVLDQLKRARDRYVSFDIERQAHTGRKRHQIQPHWDEGTKNGPDRSALLGHNFVYQETKPHGFYSSYFHQRISS